MMFKRVLAMMGMVATARCYFTNSSTEMKKQLQQQQNGAAKWEEGEEQEQEGEGFPYHSSSSSSHQLAIASSSPVSVLDSASRFYKRSPVVPSANIIIKHPMWKIGTQQQQPEAIDTVKEGSEHDAGYYNSKKESEEVRRIALQMALLKQKRKEVSRMLRERRNVERKQQSEAKLLATYAEKPWLAIGVPLVTNAFSLYMRDKMGQCRRSFSKSEKDLYRQELVLRWKAKDAIPRNEKSIYFIAATRNKDIKNEVERMILSGCPNFEAMCKKLRHRVATAASIRSEIQQKKKKNKKQNNDSRKNNDPSFWKRNGAAVDSLKDVWGRVARGDVADDFEISSTTSSSSSTSVDAQMALLEMMEEQSGYGDQSH